MQVYIYGKAAKEQDLLRFIAGAKMKVVANIWDANVIFVLYAERNDRAFQKRQIKKKTVVLTREDPKWSDSLEASVLKEGFFVCTAWPEQSLDFNDILEWLS